jgi:hypothetical protein
MEKETIIKLNKSFEEYSSVKSADKGIEKKKLKGKK